MMGRRLLLAALALLTACRNPTAPEVIPECTVSIDAGMFVVHRCYRPCPPGSEQSSTVLGLAYTTEYLCQ